MTYEIYRYIFIGGAILSGIMLVVSVLVFFLLKIPTVIGDLSGSNARKAIENIRMQNESTGAKAFRVSHVNKERGKITDRISPSGRLIRKPVPTFSGAMATEKIGTQRLTQEAVSANETTVLANDDSGATTLLSQESYANETTVLNAEPVINAFVVEYEITYIHTDEMIA